MSKLSDLVSFARRLPLSGLSDLTHSFEQHKPAEASTQTHLENLSDRIHDAQISNVTRPHEMRPSNRKPGQQHARWHNPFIGNAMPAISRARKHLEDGTLNQPEVRAKLVQEIRLFRERISQAGAETQQVNDASYLLCTYLDEFVSDFARDQNQSPYQDDRSLLVEFHGDAWGGEDAFQDLEHWMRQEPSPRAFLALYELVLSLGWQGRYRIRDRGEISLQDLRSQLNAIVWQHASPLSLGTPLVILPSADKNTWTWQKKWSVACLSLAVLYGLGNLSLDLNGRSLRAELAAWEPPLRTINLAETLPPPLPELLAEGWLSAYKHPLGWLLVFKSDGAFDVGKAEFKPQFVRNIERLGQALAPWPGDLEVIGHTDVQPIQSPVFPSNLALSQARAAAAADTLRELSTVQGRRAPVNVVQREILSSGRGETEPADAARTPAAYERNRRVDVLWKVLSEPQNRNHSSQTKNPTPYQPAPVTHSVSVRY